VDIADETNATLTLSGVQSTSEGAYRVVVSNEVAAIASSNANFSLVTVPIIFSQSQPTNPVVIYESNMTLSVTAFAPGQNNGFPLGYQWQFNATNLTGANSSAYTIAANTNCAGTYSVLITNAAGSTSAVWQASFTFEGSYIGTNTLAYHLSTNAVGYAAGYSGGFYDELEVSGWSYAFYTETNMALLTNAVWSTNFWLKGVQGLSATCIGFSNSLGGQGLVTMVSPRHCLFAEHMHSGLGYFTAAFLDTNNVIYWRTNVETIFLGNDTSLGILDADLPASVGYLPILPTNFSNYLPTNKTSKVQGIGMNQDLRRFGQPMTLRAIDHPDPIYIGWSHTNTAPFGLETNWNVPLRGGDSSAPEMFLIHNQLVLATHNYYATFGPNYGIQFDLINQKMHYLSTNNSAGTDYQLTPFPLTNWPTIH
jgi:hypothetical protein